MLFQIIQFGLALLEEPAKVPDQLLVCGKGDLWRTWMIQNWSCMSPSDSFDHTGSILYHLNLVTPYLITNQMALNATALRPSCAHKNFFLCSLLKRSQHLFLIPRRFDQRSLFFYINIWPQLAVFWCFFWNFKPGIAESTEKTCVEYLTT